MLTLQLAGSGEASPTFLLELVAAIVYWRHPVIRKSEKSCYLSRKPELRTRRLRSLATSYPATCGFSDFAAGARLLKRRLATRLKRRTKNEPRLAVL